ncbi:F-box domain-containing protein [Mycena sanguinolenta]|uniref:F-box domain-containing protein n=1 Tax=Mycena sanguinolenta TaxID=230812 RepID=A0A8H6Y2E7_9AGAR|nr:F-box domain-containing protein [Mycena sanguinolenta]
MILSELPTDILFEIVKLLPLPDPLALLLTCRSLNALSNALSFWISVLKTTRKRSPIACSPDTDLSQFPLPRLKNLAISWLQLQHNWNQPLPRVVRPPISHRLFKPEAEIIYAVQGTDILVLTSGDCVFCWDVFLGVPFPSAIYTGGEITQNAGSDLPGVCYVAVIATMSTAAHDVRRGYIMTIKHEGGKVTSITSECSQISTPQLDLESLFVAGDMVGTIGSMEHSEDCLVAVDGVGGENRLPTSNNTLKLHRSISEHAFLVCIPYQGHLYILLEDASSVQIHHISRKSLRAGRQEECGRYYSKINLSYPNFEPLCYTVPSTPFYGVTATFVRLHWNFQNETALVTSFTFLLNILTDAHDDDSGTVSPLEFAPDCVTEYVPGQLVDITLIWQDHSGLDVTAVIQPNDLFEPPRLILVRYHPETKSTSVHDFIVPDTIDVKNLERPTVDFTLRL